MYAAALSFSGRENMNTAQLLEWILTGGALTIALFIASNLLERSPDFQAFDSLAKAFLVGLINVALVVLAVFGTSLLTGRAPDADSFVVPLIPVIAYWAQQVNHQGSKAKEGS